MKTQDTVTYDASAALILTSSAQSALTNATDYVIDSPAMFELAGDDLKRIKSLQKEVEEKRTGITGPLNQAVKAVNDLFRAPKDYLDKAEATLKRSMVAWATEQDRLIAEARRKAEAEAQVERDRLARIEAEANEQARKAEAEAQAAAEAGDKEAAAKAIQAAQEANQAALMATMTANVTTVAPQVDAPAKMAGISGRVTYSAEVNDLKALIKAVAEGNAPIECIQADTKFLGAQARAFKKSGQLYPGVVAKEERGIAARAA